MKPVCPDDNYELTNDCKCIKKQIKTVKKLPPCKPGKVRNPKTNRCIKKVESKTKTIAKPKSVTKKTPTKTKTVIKRCPKGTKKNKKTGLCESSNINVKIPSATPFIQEKVGNQIMSELNVKSKSPKVTKKNINKLVRSFSPLVNKRLIARQSGMPKYDELLCENSKNLSDIYSRKGIEIPKIMVGGKCYTVFSEKAKTHLLNLLSYSRNNLKITDVTAPKQVASNCWFNSMFMTFFISNKGRKFYKFLRQLMIEGKRSDGTSLKPGLKKTFAYFNLAIEASMNPNLNILDSFDTNTIIQNIYKNIPESFRKNNQLKGYYIKNVGQAGNPVNYYVAITNFLVTKGVKYLNLELLSKTSVLGKDGLKKGTRSIKNTIYYHIKSSFNRKNIMPEVIMVGVIDEVSSEYPNDNTTLEFNNVKYVLDSAIVRDTKARHFCALLNIGKDQCGFDGVSYRKLSKFKWTPFLGKDKSWTFDGSNWADTQNPVLWNFRKGYSILIYYRS